VNKDILKLLVNDQSAGDGVQEINLSYSGPDKEIGFNSKNLIDVGGVVEDKNMMIYAKDPSSPVLIHDPADINSLHVIMPMRVA
jgi:DNA polymerase III sliding clamp (beta) subunit (PCNA family)